MKNLFHVLLFSSFICISMMHPEQRNVSESKKVDHSCKVDRADYVVIGVDTTLLHAWNVTGAMMKKTRTSILVMGPLLARFGKARIGGMPGGDAIGKRPIDYHLKNFAKMGVVIHHEGDELCAEVEKLTAAKIIFEYPSVGATENIIMAATRAQGTTKIINAACVSLKFLI